MPITCPLHGTCHDAPACDQIAALQAELREAEELFKRIRERLEAAGIAGDKEWPAPPSSPGREPTRAHRPTGEMFDEAMLRMTDAESWLHKYRCATFRFTPYGAPPDGPLEEAPAAVREVCARLAVQEAKR